MPTTTELPTGTWTLDTTATTVTVTVKKLGLITVPATLTVTSGTIEIDDAGRIARVEVSADAASYTSKNPKRNDHVTSADFLDATNHPEIVFTAQAVTPSGAGYTAEGTVTIKGRTSPLDLAISDVAVDGTAGSFTATATVDRKAIGVDKMPAFVIGRTLTIDIAATAVKA